MNTFSRLARVGAGLAVLAFLAIPPASGQGIGGGLGGPGGGHVGTPSGGKDKAPTAPPDALPGAAVNKDRIIPSDHGASDMQPTDALFDSINRGDITDARDAISRGADITGRNVLGLTPLDLSVDLGRNDITFLLLSLRGQDTPVGPPRATQASAKPARPAKAARSASDALLAVRASAAAAPPHTAPLFAGNGGTPVPNAGFLGFDTTQH